MAHDLTLGFLQGALESAEILSGSANAFNLLGDVPWSTRERIRTIEGLADKIVMEAIESIGRIGTDEAEAFLATIE